MDIWQLKCGWIDGTDAVLVYFALITYKNVKTSVSIYKIL